MAKAKKEKSVVDQIKRIEKIKKAQLLAKVLTEIKSKAKEVLVLKEETKAVLEEIGLCETDIKKVIDYVNSEVKLSSADKKEIREEARVDKEAKEEEVEKKMDKHPFDFSNLASGGGGGGNNTPVTTGADYRTSSTSSDLSVTLGNYTLKM